MSRIGASAAIILLALAACHNSTEPAVGDSSLTVANATLGTLDISIDGHSVTFGGLSMNGLSNSFSLPAGVHRIRLGESGLNPVSTEITLETRPFTLQTLVVYPSPSGKATGPATTVLVDSGTYVPTGKSQLRVANLAAGAAAIEIWRSEPGSATGSRIIPPFAIGTASPYFESDPGVWEVWTTAVGSATKTASSGPIEIPEYGRRTVLLLDSPAGPRFVVVGY
jgi:hypothetical protein